MSFTVLVDDNHHYQDESERFKAGTFETEKEAFNAAMEIVLKSLRECWKPGATPEQLWEDYMLWGDDPFISGAGRQIPFSAWSFARLMCCVICAEMERES